MSKTLNSFLALALTANLAGCGANLIQGGHPPRYVSNSVKHITIPGINEDARYTYLTKDSTLSYVQVNGKIFHSGKVFEKAENNLKNYFEDMQDKDLKALDKESSWEMEDIWNWVRLLFI